MAAEDRKELNETEKLELQLQWLFSDLSVQQHIEEVFEWREALGFKLRALRYVEGKLVAMAHSAPGVVKEEMKQPGVLMRSTPVVIENARLNLEFFFYLGTAFFDILAKLTKRFYPRNEKSFPNDQRLYFTDIVRILTETGIDKEYAELLSKHRYWITSIYNNRNVLAHSASSFIGFDENWNMIFEKRSPEQAELWREHKNENLAEYLEEIASNLYDFLEHYLAHFRKVVPESESTQILRKALETGEIKTIL